MKYLISIILFTLPFYLQSQVEVTSSGRLKLNAIDANNNASNLVARQTDGTLVVRNISTLPAPLSVLSENTSLNRVGVRTSNPQFTFDIVHANGSPAAGSSDPHNGLNIRHEGSNNNQWTLYVSNASGTLSFYKNAIKEIEFTADGSVNMLSDRNAKRDINSISIGLHQLMKITPSEYKYKASDSGKLCYGFIAQDLEKVFPNLVSFSNEDASPTYAVNYIGLIPVLTKSIQEQQAIIENQGERIEKLELVVKQLLEKI